MSSSIIGRAEPTREALTEDEVRSFHADGYLVVRNAIPAGAIAALRADTQRLIDLHRDYRKQPFVYYAEAAPARFEDMLADKGDAPAGGKVLWRIDKLEDRLSSLTTLRDVPFIGEAMRALLGPRVIFYNEALVVKVPRVAPPVVWHQDPSFKIRKTPDPITTIDIYLDDSDEENGCLWVVPGSHRLGVADPQALMRAHGFALPGAVPVRMKAGDVAFHDNGCLHGSQGNASDRIRRVVYLAFQTVRQAEAGGAYTAEQVQAWQRRFDDWWSPD